MVRKIDEKPSQQTIDEAMQIARGTQQPGQTKEQTKLIAQGIEKGIAQYKKQQKAKARAADKAKKQSLKNKVAQIDAQSIEQGPAGDDVQKQKNYLPWILLAISWMLFGAYFFWV